MILDVGTRVLTRVRELQREAPAVGLAAHLRRATDDEIAELKRDAERWRALVSSQRIRVIGSARLGTPDGLLSVEMWGGHAPVDEREQEYGVRRLTEYADGLR